jgi:hypothetical protein
MSSVLRYIAQKPTVTLNNGDYAGYIYQKSDLDSAFSGAKSDGYVYTFPNDTTFDQGVQNLVNLSVPTLDNGSQEYTFIDMGKKIWVGTPTENNLIVFKLIKRVGSSLNGGEPDVNPSTGYVIVSSRVTSPNGHGSTYKVAAAMWAGAY